MICIISACPLMAEVYCENIRSELVICEMLAMSRTKMISEMLGDDHEKASVGFAAPVPDLSFCSFMLFSRFN